MIEQAQAHHTQVQGIPSSAAFSSSAFSSSSSGTSRSVMMANGRTWTIESDGLSISSSNTGTTRHVKIVIGDPETLSSSIGEDNSLKVDMRYGDGTTKWAKLTLDSPTRVKDLNIERRNGILYITGEMWTELIQCKFIFKTMKI